MKPVGKAFDAEACTGCKVCVQKCPVNAISMETLEIDQEKCLNCMRCVRVCPEQARTFDASSVCAYLEDNYSQPREVEYFI